MADRPYVLLSCAVSLDGFLDAGAGRLALSNEADLTRVRRLRAGCDAIMIGAGTLRNDDPRLLADDEATSPAKVTLTASGRIDPAAQFFTCGSADKLVYAAAPVAGELTRRLAGLATVVDAGDPLRLGTILQDLDGRGIDRLMVEGGGRLLTQLLIGELADELQLAIAPFLVGDERATRFVGPGRFPWHAGRRAELVETAAIGDIALLRYALSDRFNRC